MEKLVRASAKGQVVIATQMRKRLKIRRVVRMRDEGGRILVEPFTSLEESFGAGGVEMLEVAKEISRDPRREAST